jgi:serine protease Do
MPSSLPNRLWALSLLTLLLLGGAVAGVAWRSDKAAAGVWPPGDPATREAVRQATSLSDAFIAIAEVVTPSVVQIEVERLVADEAPLTGRLEDLFQRPSRPREFVPQVGGGSGFIVSADGYILTNNHVIAGADRIMVTLRDKRTLPATVVGADPTTDVAVIRIEATDLPAVPLGDSEAARVGEWVLAVGNPGFDAASTLDFTVTGGIISAKGRPLNILHAEQGDGDSDGASYAIEDFIQTDAVINPGNSGGPLVDLRGTVIGINTAIASTTGYSQGYGFAIPSNLARRVMRDLIEYGYVRRPLLGITIADVSQEDAEVYRLPTIAGVVVEDLAGDSPARQSGVQRHDVIVEVDGTPVERIGHLQRLVAQHQPGEHVALTVVRYGERLKFRIRLSEAPAAARAAQPRPPPATVGIGLELEDLTPELARQLGYSAAGGAVVARVAPASAADRKSIVEQHRVAAINHTRSLRPPRPAPTSLCRCRRDRDTPHGVPGRKDVHCECAGALGRHGNGSGDVNVDGDGVAQRGAGSRLALGPGLVPCPFTFTFPVPDPVPCLLDFHSLFRESGGTGRRARLRISWACPWGFESPLSHSFSQQMTRWRRKWWG